MSDPQPDSFLHFVLDTHRATPPPAPILLSIITTEAPFDPVDLSWHPPIAVPRARSPNGSSHVQKYGPKYLGGEKEKEAAGMRLLQGASSYMPSPARRQALSKMRREGGHVSLFSP